MLELTLPSGVSYAGELPPFPEEPTPPQQPKGALDLTAKLLSAPPRSDLLLSDIRDHLSVRHELAQDFVRSLRDRGQSLLRVSFGKILQRTFRDREVRFLAFDRRDQYKLPYRLICEQLARPIEGTFVIKMADGEVVPEYLRKHWRV